MALNKNLSSKLCIYIPSPLASSRFKSLASTLLSRSAIFVLGGLPGRRPPFRPRTLRSFSLSGFGGRPRRPVMAIIMEGTSSLAKSTHAAPFKVKINQCVRHYNFNREDNFCFGMTDLRTFSFFVKIPNRHSWAKAEVFSRDQTVGVFFQVLKADTDKKTKFSSFKME